MRTRQLTIVSTLAATALLAAACGNGGGDPAAHPPVSGEEVAVRDNRFEPINLGVTTGDTVTWAWEGSSPHDVVGDGYDSGVQANGTFTHTFDTPGTYDYECTLHRGMTARITVTDG